MRCAPVKFQKIPFTNKNFSLIDQFSGEMSDMENGLRSSPFWRVLTKARWGTETHFSMPLLGYSQRWKQNIENKAWLIFKLKVSKQFARWAQIGMLVITQWNYSCFDKNLHICWMFPMRDRQLLSKFLPIQSLSKRQYFA